MLSTSPILPTIFRQIYAEERYLHVPLFAAWTLNRAGDYPAAHDWYRQLYDPFRSPSKFGFPFATYFDGDFSRSSAWLADSLDPFATAAQRRGTYLRHVIIMMVKNLLDWADHEFSLAGPESINRARELYLLAERILAAPELNNLCEQGLGKLGIEITTSFGIEAPVLVSNIALLDNITSSNIVAATIAKITDILHTQRSPIEFSKLARSAVQEALKQEAANKTPINLGMTLGKSNERIQATEDALLLQQFDQIMALRPVVTGVKGGTI
jgi:hypothetical protein